MYTYLIVKSQSDSDNERRQHVFMEKRQRALRKRRKKSSTVPVKSEQYNLGNIHAGRLVSLPGMFKGVVYINYSSFVLSWGLA